MRELIIFGILSLPIIFISWRTLFNLKNHGFYRFFSWECILWLFISNVRYWFRDPLSIMHLLSWIFLLFSVYLIISGVLKMKSAVKSEKRSDEKSLYEFEKTSELIDTGIFKYIRHPLYSSLLFLTWGICFKNATLLLLVVSLLSSFSLYVTARFDEKECIQFFGNKYREYMKRSKMFIPFLL